MPLEWGAIVILATAVLGLFGYVHSARAELNVAREKFAKDLADFREHVAQEYARNGAVEKGFDKLAAAMDKLSGKLEALSLQVASGALARGSAS